MQGGKNWEVLPYPECLDLVLIAEIQTPAARDGQTPKINPNRVTLCLAATHKHPLWRHISNYEDMSVEKYLDRPRIFEIEDKTFVVLPFRKFTTGAKFKAACEVLREELHERKVKPNIPVITTVPTEQLIKAISSMCYQFKMGQSETVPLLKSSPQIICDPYELIRVLSTFAPNAVKQYTVDKKIFKPPPEDIENQPPIKPKPAPVRKQPQASSPLEQIPQPTASTSGLSSVAAVPGTGRKPTQRRPRKGRKQKSVEQTPKLEAQLLGMSKEEMEQLLGMSEEEIMRLVREPTSGEELLLNLIQQTPEHKMAELFAIPGTESSETAEDPEDGLIKLLRKSMSEEAAAENLSIPGSSKQSFLSMLQLGENSREVPVGKAFENLVQQLVLSENEDAEFSSMQSTSIDPPLEISAEALIQLLMPTEEEGVLSSSANEESLLGSIQQTPEQQMPETLLNLVQRTPEQNIAALLEMPIIESEETPEKMEQHWELSEKELIEILMPPEEDVKQSSTTPVEAAEESLLASVDDIQELETEQNSEMPEKEVAELFGFSAEDVSRKDNASVESSLNLTPEQRVPQTTETSLNLSQRTPEENIAALLGMPINESGETPEKMEQQMEISEKELIRILMPPEEDVTQSSTIPVSAEDLLLALVDEIEALQTDQPSETLENELVDMFGFSIGDSASIESSMTLSQQTPEQRLLESAFNLMEQTSTQPTELSEEDFAKLFGLSEKGLAETLAMASTTQETLFNISQQTPAQHTAHPVETVEKEIDELIGLSEEELAAVLRDLGTTLGPSEDLLEEIPDDELELLLQNLSTTKTDSPKKGKPPCKLPTKRKKAVASKSEMQAKPPAAPSENGLPPRSPPLTLDDEMNTLFVESNIFDRILPTQPEPESSDDSCRKGVCNPWELSSPTLLLQPESSGIQTTKSRQAQKRKSPRLAHRKACNKKIKQSSLKELNPR